eukprot:1161391-Pelagomonas_calceolata.AAC.4
MCGWCCPGPAQACNSSWSNALHRVSALWIDGTVGCAMQVALLGPRLTVQQLMERIAIMHIIRLDRE